MGMPRPGVLYYAALCKLKDFHLFHKQIGILHRVIPRHSALTFLNAEHVRINRFDNGSYAAHGYFGMRRRYVYVNGRIFVVQPLYASLYLFYSVQRAKFLLSFGYPVRVPEA